MILFIHSVSLPNLIYYSLHIKMRDLLGQFEMIFTKALFYSPLFIVKCEMDSPQIHTKAKGSVIVSFRQVLYHYAHMRVSKVSCKKTTRMRRKCIHISILYEKGGKLSGLFIVHILYKNSIDRGMIRCMVINDRKGKLLSQTGRLNDHDKV